MAREEQPHEAPAARPPTHVREPLTPGDLLADDAARTPSLALATRTLRALESLTRYEAALDLALGSGLERLCSAFGLEKLAHSRGVDFAPARLGLSWSRVKELRSSARRLDALPLLRAAFLAGDISSSRLRIILRVADEATQAGWLAFARDRSTRELEAAVRAFRNRERPAPEPAEGDGGVTTEPAAGDDEDMVRVSWDARPIDAALFRSWGKAMVRQVMGRAVKDWEVAEALATEALSALGQPPPPTERLCGIDQRPVRPRGSAPRPESSVAPSSEDLAGATASLSAEPPPDLQLPDLDQPESAWDLLELLQDLMAERHGLEAERARLLRLALDTCACWQVGLETHDALVQRVLGMSPQEAGALVELDRRLGMRPALREAWLQGRTSRLVASLLLPVVTPTTERAWLEHAAAVSFKRLEVEVEAHVALRDSMPADAYEAATGGLPSMEPLAKQRLDWREAFGVRERRRRATGQAKVDAPAAPASEGGGACPPPSQPGGQPPADPRAVTDATIARRAAHPTCRRVRVSFMAPRTVARLLDDAVGCVSAQICPLDVEFSTPTTAAACIEWMLVHFAHTHASPEDEERRLAHAILERADYNCEMPHCREMRWLHVHHPLPRSRGGPLEPWNEMGGCGGCHLGIVHAGYADTVGRMPDALDVILRGPSPGPGMTGPVQEVWRDERLTYKRARATQAWRRPSGQREQPEYEAGTAPEVAVAALV